MAADRAAAVVVAANGAANGTTNGTTNGTANGAANGAADGPTDEVEAVGVAADGPKKPRNLKGKGKKKRKGSKK